MNVLVSFVPIKKINKLNQFMIERKLDYRHILDIALVGILSTILAEQGSDFYKESQRLALKAQKFLMTECVNDKQRVLGITYLLKAMASHFFP